MKKTLKFELKNVDYYCGGVKAQSTYFDNNFMSIYFWLWPGFSICSFVV